MFSSGFRRRLALVACLLCGISASGIATADDADDLANAIVTHIHDRQPAASLAPAEASRLTSFVRYILKTFYFPANPRDLKTATFTAIDALDPTTDAPSMAQEAMGAIVNSLGHGARFLTTLGADYAAPGTPGGPGTRMVGSLRVVTLPTMNIGDPNVRRTCADFVRYFDPKSTDGVTGYVLDLRGNEGGSMSDSSCLVGFFLKSGQNIFQTVNKQGEFVKYETEATGFKPVNLPVAILIDNRTDSGAFLVAAVLQSQRHATVIGEQKPAVNDGVSSLVFPPGANRGVVLPTGEILLNDKHPLSTGIHLDVAMPAQDETAMLNAAGAYLAQQKK